MISTQSEELYFLHYSTLFFCILMGDKTEGFLKEHEITFTGRWGNTATKSNTYKTFQSHVFAAYYSLAIFQNPYNFCFFSLNGCLDRQD